MISNKERSKQKEWHQPDYYDDWYYPLRQKVDRTKTENWVSIDDKYARSTKTGQIVNKKDGKMLQKLFLDNI